MSRYVAALVYRKKLGSIARKSIMAYCAERANDDGSGVWASKVRIAKEVECSKHTVIDTMRTFVSEGLMIEVGQRRTTNGYVVEYALNIAQISALPDALTDDELTGAILDRSTEFTPRGATETPQEVQLRHPNRPLTVLKPSNTGEADLFSAEDLPKKKPDEVTSILTEVLPEATAKDWIAHRKALKKALTPQGARLMVGKLREADDPVACVEVSMMNGWQGVFPERAVKDQPTGGHRLQQNWGEIVR